LSNKGKQRDRKLTTANRQAEALRLRAEGHDYQTIADRLGYRSRSGPWRAVRKALADVKAEGVEHLRTLEGQRLDRLLAAVWPKAMSGNVGAVRAALRICDRRARLQGLDAPSRGVVLTADAVAVLEAMPEPFQDAVREELRASYERDKGGV